MLKNNKSKLQLFSFVLCDVFFKNGKPRCLFLSWMYQHIKFCDTLVCTYVCANTNVYVSVVKRVCEFRYCLMWVLYANKWQFAFLLLEIQKELYVQQWLSTMFLYLLCCWITNFKEMLFAGKCAEIKECYHAKIFLQYLACLRGSFNKEYYFFSK